MGDVEVGNVKVRIRALLDGFKSSIDQAKTAVKDLGNSAKVSARGMTDLGQAGEALKNQLWAVKERAKLLGKEYDANAAKADALRRAIEELTLEGHKAEEQEMQKLAAEYRQTVQEMKRAEQASLSLSERLKSQAEGFRTVAVAAGAAFAAIIYGMKTSTEASNQAKAGLLGLDSVARSFGQDADRAKQAAIDLAEDGLAPMTTYAVGLKNLLSSGLGLPEAIKLLEAFKDRAAFGRNAAISFDQAIINLTQSFKTEQSELGDASGLTENYSKLIERGAQILGKKTTELTNAERAQAKYLAILEASIPYEGDAARAADTAAGAQARLGSQALQLRQAIGDSLEPALKDLLAAFTPVVKSSVDWVKANPELVKSLALVTAALTGLVAAAGALGLALPGIIAGVGLLVTPVGLAATALAGLATGATLAKAALDGQAEAQERELANAKALLDEYQELSKKATLTANEKARLAEVSSQLARLFPSMVEGIDSERGAIIDVTEALKEWNKQMEQAARNRRGAALVRLDQLASQEADYSAALLMGRRFVALLEGELKKNKPDWNAIRRAWGDIPENVRALFPEEWRAATKEGLRDWVGDLKGSLSDLVVRLNKVRQAAADAKAALVEDKPGSPAKPKAGAAGVPSSSGTLDQEFSKKLRELQDRLKLGELTTDTYAAAVAELAKEYEKAGGKALDFKLAAMEAADAVEELNRKARGPEGFDLNQYLLQQIRSVDDEVIAAAQKEIFEKIARAGLEAGRKATVEALREQQRKELDEARAAVTADREAGGIADGIAGLRQLDEVLAQNTTAIAEANVVTQEYVKNIAALKAVWESVWQANTQVVKDFVVSFLEGTASIGDFWKQLRHNMLVGWVNSIHEMMKQGKTLTDALRTSFTSLTEILKVNFGNLWGFVQKVGLQVFGVIKTVFMGLLNGIWAVLQALWAIPIVGPILAIAAAAAVANAIANFANSVGAVFNPGGQPKAGEPPKAGSSGTQISEITGPTRDLLVSLLKPLDQLPNFFSRLLETNIEIRDILRAGLGVSRGQMQLAAAGAGGGCHIDNLTVTATFADTSSLDRFARMLAEVSTSVTRGNGG
ncbi:MAG: phage tail tape measure protein [Bacillota bacterium]|nr:phage tail tape measure protein [Bacillota bacterium]